MEIINKVELMVITKEELLGILELSEDETFSIILIPESRGIYNGELLFTLNMDSLHSYIANKSKESGNFKNIKARIM